MGIPVVIAENGLGVPVRPVESGAPVMTVASNGLGVPIVISDLGVLFIVEGLAPPGTGDPASIEGEDQRVYVRTSSDNGAPVDLLSLSAMSIMLDIPPETITGAGTNSLILEVPDAPV